MAFVLVSTQKTEGLAFAVIAALASSLEGEPSVAELSLPVIMYHSLQMVVASLLVPFIRLPERDKLSLRDADGGSAAAVCDAAEPTNASVRPAPGGSGAQIPPVL